MAYTELTWHTVQYLHSNTLQLHILDPTMNSFIPFGVHHPMITVSSENVIDINKNNALTSTSALPYVKII